MYNTMVKNVNGWYTSVIRLIAGCQLDFVKKKVFFKRFDFQKKKVFATKKKVFRAKWIAF